MLALNNNIADIIEATPRRRIDFDMSRIDIGKLTLLELLDAADASEISVDEFRDSLLNEQIQARLVYALAWVVLRRVEHDLTFEQACEFDLIVSGEGSTQKSVSDLHRNEQRAKATVAVASLANVSTREAEQMTMDEISAVTDLAQRRNRAARRRK